MIILKWIAYILALGAFIWYVFLRGTDFSFDDKSSVQAEVSSQIESDYTDSSENIEPIDASEYVEEATDDYFAEDSSESTVYEEEVSVSEIPEDLNITTIESETPETEATSSNEVEIDESLNTNASFLLIVGSFGNKSNADRLLKKVKSEYPKSTVTFTNGLNRVIVSSFNDEEAAEVAKSQYIQNTGGSAFVLAQ